MLIRGISLWTDPQSLADRCRMLKDDRMKGQDLQSIFNVRDAPNRLG